MKQDPRALPDASAEEIAETFRLRPSDVIRDSVVVDYWTGTPEQLLDFLGSGKGWTADRVADYLASLRRVLEQRGQG